MTLRVLSRNLSGDSVIGGDTSVSTKPKEVQEKKGVTVGREGKIGTRVTVSA